MTEKTNIKILVCYHKPAYLIKDDIFIPIHLGRILATQASKDGKMSQEDYQWMLDNMIGDDTGDNISELNRLFNEMSAVYWAWKNYDKLGNPDYIGINHYRRFFNFPCLISDNKICFEHNELYEAISQADIICDKFFSYDKGLYQHYLDHQNWGFNPIFFDEVLKILSSDKNYAKFQHAFTNNQTGPLFNCFIMPREVFFDYCKWIFPVIFELYQRFKDFPYEEKEKRNIAWMSERLTCAYIYCCSEKYKIKQIPLAKIDTKIIFQNNIIRNVVNYKKNKLNYFRCRLLANLTFGKTRAHYKRKKKELKIKLKSVKQFLKG